MKQISWRWHPTVFRNVSYDVRRVFAILFNCFVLIRTHMDILTHLNMYDEKFLNYSRNAYIIPIWAYRLIFWQITRMFCYWGRPVTRVFWTWVEAVFKSEGIALRSKNLYIKISSHPFHEFVMSMTGKWS